jgi:hypothetical protein
VQNKGIVIACFAAVVAACAWMLFVTPPGAGNAEADVEKAFESYVQAFARGDGQGACDALTEEARAAVKSLAGSVGARDCADAFQRTLEIGGDEVTKAARRIKVHKVRINGGAATVELRSGSQDSIAQLEWVGDTWKISSLPRG